MVFELVTGQVLLSKRPLFIELHSTILIPTYKKLGIQIVCCLMTEVGDIGKFIDIYQYSSYGEYDEKTFKLEQLLKEVGYYDKIQNCIQGSISVQLMNKFYNEK